MNLKDVKDLADGLEGKQANAIMGLIDEKTNNDMEKVLNAMQLLKSSIEHKMDSIETKLETKIDSVETKLETKIEAQNSRIDTLNTILWRFAIGLGILIGGSILGVVFKQIPWHRWF